MNASVRVRPAVAADVVRIRAMNLVFNESDVSAESIAEKLNTPSAEMVLVAEAIVAEAMVAGAARTVVGFAIAQVQSSICYDDARAELVEIYGEPGSRRSGVGRALVSEIGATARRRGARSLFLRTNQMNLDGRSFFHACSMVEVPETVFEKSL
jgi:GNAT superfamily N-acetyltransferase